MRAPFASSLLAVLLSAFAADAQSLPDGEGTPAVLPVTLNTVARGDFTVIVRESDILMSAEDLAAFGINLPREVVETSSRGGGWLSLSALAPLIRHRFDESSFSVELTADPELFSEQRLDARAGGPPATIEYASNPSMFLNYAMGGRIDELGLFTEAGWSRGPNSLRTTLSYTPQGDLRRGSTQFVHDDRNRLRRWIVGDSTLGTARLGGRPNLAGISVVRSFDLDPYFVRYPRMGLDAIAETPSTVEVYVNGNLVRRDTVDPGRFRLDDLPVPTGSGDVRVVVRDAFGRATEASRSYYLGTEVLRKGLVEYEAGAGVLRDLTSMELFDYTGPAAYGELRYGLTDRTTVGGRLEAGDELLSGDLSADLRTRLGEFGATLAASTSEFGSGTGFVASWRYLGRRVSGGVSTLSASDDYATLSTGPGRLAQITRDTTGFVSVPWRIGTTAFQVSHQESTIAGERWRYAVTGNFPVGTAGYLFATGAHVREANVGHQEYTAGLSWLFGSTNVGVQARSTPSGDLVGLDVQKPLSTGTGYGYRINLSEGERETGAAALQYQTTFGRYEVLFDPLHLSDDPSISVSGGVVGIGGRVLPTRAVSQSYALVRVPGVEGVRVYRSNQEIGRTDRRGDLLVSEMLPYYGNSLSINDEDVPLDYLVADVDLLIAPSYRAGALVEFPVTRNQSVTGRLVLDENGARTPPSLGDLHVRLGEGYATSPIGRDARFWLEKVPAGAHHATIRFGGRECQFELVVPESNEALIDLGEVTCRP